MSHPASFRCRFTHNESVNGFGHMLGNVLDRVFLEASSNLANHQDPLRIRVSLEQFQQFDKSRPQDRIAANTNAGRDTDTRFPPGC